MVRRTQDSSRLLPLADFAKRQLFLYGLHDVQGGTGGEIEIHGFARSKTWDLVYDFAGKKRLLISLKSVWRNPSGTVPNRIDDLMGEAANIQQMSPEIVIGYILLFDTAEDYARKKDAKTWSDFFEEAVKRIAIRKAPLWNQGLIEGTWFIKIDSRNDAGERVLDPAKTLAEGEAFFRALLDELKLREPAIPFTSTYS